MRLADILIARSLEQTVKQCIVGSSRTVCQYHTGINRERMKSWLHLVVLRSFAMYYTNRGKRSSGGTIGRSYKVASKDDLTFLSLCF